jgi:hypothetical protein
MRRDDDSRKFTGDLKMSPNGKHFVHRGESAPDSDMVHRGGEVVITTLPHVIKKEGQA